MHPLQNEPGWTTREEEERTTYTRPLLGSELLVDRLSQCFDGLAECCMGFEFELKALQPKTFIDLVKRAWAHLRFDCPNIAAYLEPIEDEELRSWVYRPAQDSAEVHTWVERTLIVLDNSQTAEEFILKQTEKKISLLDPEIIIRCYIFPILETTSTFGVFMHGSHTLLDAKATFNAFRIMCESMVQRDSDCFNIDSLPWGTEWHNLPAGPITATGGPPANWESQGLLLTKEMRKIAIKQPPPWCLPLPPKLPTQSEVMIPGHPIRVHSVIDQEDTKEILTQTKLADCFLINLFEAALALAICEINPVPNNRAGDARIAFPMSIVTLDKWLTEEEKLKDSFISRFSLLAVEVGYNVLAAPLPHKKKLVRIMKLFKKQYDAAFTNPHFPHLTTTQLAMNPPRTFGTSANNCPSITNLGAVDSTVPPKWHLDGDSKQPLLFQVEKMAFGHRLLAAQPIVHVWSICGAIHIQVQAPDVWDVGYIRDFSEKIREKALHVLCQL